MPVAKGYFILLDYAAKVKETNMIFDTSIADMAKEAKIYKEKAIYEPMLVVVGEGWVLKGLDEKLVNLELQKKTTIEVPPTGGFGPRDPGKIRLVSLRKFRQQKIAPYPGLEVEMEGKSAVVRSVGAGRVQVDFNPPLAGKTLVYDVEVKRIFETPIEKIRALIHRRIPTVDAGKSGVKLSEKALNIDVPEEAFALDGLQLAKRGIVADIQKCLPEVEVITFVERHVRKEAKGASQPQREEERP